ncbi:CRISPR system precrRNA processing endoribonuclease RAMP protein Cas6 [Actinophytocola sp. KF-1]
MPSRWELTIPDIDPTTIRLEHLHAVASAWLDQPGQHHTHSKPYTISPPSHSISGTVVEIGLLEDHLTHRLLNHTTHGTRIRLGRSTTTLASPPQQVAVAPWTELAAPRTTSAWRLTFVTPLTFRRGNKFTPFPNPKAILGGLRANWQTHAPPELRQIHLDLTTDPVWVTDINGHNEIITVNNRTVSGFIGQLRIESDTNHTTTENIDRLLRLAPFSGCGAYTTRGFGLTRVEPA